ncbi:MAG TPA: TetR/AcrR family transcriptional regulator [Acidimicrobiales bacterium]|nr:TetR/AcrR family transcriptional regulator [Acidimicrobiales bacterium]
MSTTTSQPRQLLNRSQRQETILVGAARAFAACGYAATSMEDVAAAAGITKLIVYRHFDSKEELYRAILQRVFDRLKDEFLTGLSGAGPRGGIGVRALYVVAREDPAGFSLLWKHAAREPQFADYAREHRDMAVAAARLLLGQSLQDPLLLAWAAEATVSWAVDAVLTWIELGDAARDQEMIELSTSGLHALVATWAKT